MKYILKTEVNGNGNKVFSKQRNGKVFVYLAKDENGNIGKVDKNWILKNQDNIVNLGVSGDNIYPTEIKKETSKAAVHISPQVVEEDDDEEIDYEDVLDYAEDFYKELGECLTFDGNTVRIATDISIAGMPFEKYLMDLDVTNPFDIATVYEKFDNAITDGVDHPFNEIGYLVEGGIIRQDDYEDIYNTINYIKDAMNRVAERFSHLYEYSEGGNFDDEQLGACNNEVYFKSWYSELFDY